MKKYYLIITIIVALLLTLGFIFGGTYDSTPGYTTEELAKEFHASSKKCIGISILTNASAVAADAPGISRCIGYLK